MAEDTEMVEWMPEEFAWHHGRMFGKIDLPSKNSSFEFEKTSREIASLYVLEGKIKASGVGRETATVSAGDAIIFDDRNIIEFINGSDKPAQMIFIVTDDLSGHIGLDEELSFTEYSELITSAPVGGIFRDRRFDELSDEDKAKNLLTYRVTGHALDSESKEFMVIYQEIFGEFKSYSTTLSEFEDRMGGDTDEDYF